MINTVKDYERLSEQYNKMLEERNSLIDDLSWYRAKVSRLEQIRDIKDSALKGADIKIKTLERKNEKLVWTLKNKEDVIDWNCLKIRGLKEDVEKYKRGVSNLINENDLKDNLLSEISQHIGNKPSSSTYKYFRAKLDNLNITEDK